jgi:short subunit dehydrogenase-like uncharacterized protein
MQSNQFLLYGANGYTGELIGRLASHYDLQPILAGRRESALKPLSEKLGFPYRVIELHDSPALRAALSEVKLVLHAAGPFHLTAAPMIEGCLQTGTHYLDINGDIGVFEMLKRHDEAAKKAGIMILPGAGFDVVPTDCLALLLKQSLPDARDLKLAIATLGGSISHGTATTMAAHIGEGGAVRKEGRIITAPLGRKGIWVDFGVKTLFAMTIPWGDISTAYWTTGIGNIETYAAISPRVYRLLKAQSLFNWLLRTAFVRGWIQRKIDKRPPGPDDAHRTRAISLVWGQVTNSAGQKATARLSGPEGYSLTAHSSLILAKKLLEGIFVPGYQTPASAYGPDLVLEIPGVKREIL